MSDLMTTKDKRFIEMMNINLSLTALGKIIQSISTGPQSLVCPPFRDSMLTRVLKPMFIGKGRTAVLVTIQPDPASTPETLNTLRFARLARKVKTVAFPRELISRRKLDTTKVQFTRQFKEEISRVRASLNSQKDQMLITSERSLPDELLPRVRSVLHSDCHQPSPSEVAYLLRENLILKQKVALLSRNQSSLGRNMVSNGIHAISARSDGEYIDRLPEIESPLSGRSGNTNKKKE